MNRPFLNALTLTAILLIVGCGDTQEASEPTVAEDAEPGLTQVILQTDWYPQPEHAGFYHALEAGYYEKAGLDVEIRPGANITNVPQMVATGRIQFALGTSDNVTLAVSRGIPLVALFPYFQHDPQCIMTHKSSGITELQQLDGRTVMISPGGGYVQYMQKTLGIKMQIVPLNYSLTRFLADPEFAQQCFLTNEPFYTTQNGVDTQIIPLSTSGFDPYRVVYANGDYVAENPKIVAAFIEASKRGWDDYSKGDGSLAHGVIARLNSQHSDASMAWSKDAMAEFRLIHGYEDKGEFLGRFNRDRAQRLVDQLAELDMLDGEVNIDEVFPLGFTD